MEDKTTAYVSFQDSTRDTVMKSYGKTMESFDKVSKVVATDLRTRSPHNRIDYLRQRPNDMMPFRFRDVLYSCRAAYLKVGIVRTVLDLMTDFAAEDLQFVHTDKKAEAFFRVWAHKVKMKDAVDEFIRHLLRDGNVVVKRTMAKLSKPVEEQWTERTAGAEEPTKLYVEKYGGSREIPWRYNFLNVGALHWVGGELARIAGEKQLAFKVSDALVNSITNPSEAFQKQMVDRIPIPVREAILNKENGGFVEINMDTVYVSHGKKDSWEDWAPPFLYSVLSDLHFKDKLRHAEIAALDGVINVIRLWKLGDHKEQILPAQGAVTRLLNLLENNTGGGAVDIVWDSMIDMEAFYPPIDEILGSEKYEQVNRDIIVGLGVPEVLIGGSGSNFSNSFIQLKTMVERLNFIRDKVIEWLNHELFIVCQAMDIKTVPIVKFNHMNLEDENVSRKLIIELLDRGVVSTEAVLQAYGEDIVIEMERMKSEKQLLKQNGLKVKSPLDPPPVKPGAGIKKPTSKRTGRPVKTQETVKRKTKQPSPRRSPKTGASLLMFAMDAIDAIDQHLVPVYIESLNLSNARQLNQEQKSEISQARLIAMSKLSPNQDLSEESVLALATEGDFNPKIVKAIEQEIMTFVYSNEGKQPTVTQRKRIEAMAWAKHYEE